MLKIAVLGGEGYLGHHVSGFFGAKALSRRNGFDIVDPDKCRTLKDYDVIIHMAAMVDKSEKQPKEVFSVNAQGTLNVLEAMRKDQILIFTSTKEVYEADDAYGLSKKIAEEYIQYYAKHTGFRAGIFRLSTTYAPPVNGGSFVNFFVKAVQQGIELSLLMKGTQKRDFLYVDDLSRAFEKFITSDKNGVYDIGGGREISTTILGLINIIEDIVGKKANISYSDDPVKGQAHYVTDLTRISKDLDWKPIVALKEGIKKII